MSILLAGCATDPQRVVVPCFTQAEIPAVPKTHVRAGMSHDQLAAAALADETDLEKYAATADGKLRACAEPPQ